jgi:hypothetical protein
MSRKLIQKNELKISILQMIGFSLMLLGVLGLITCSLIDIKSHTVVPSVISISFFITMLGFSFAFPSLLEGNDGLSTMRIIVFMVTNVICMLLLKIGWNCSDLTSIGLNQYWMGVIAFVFGAKATQSFFESKMAVPQETIKQGMAALEFSNADIAKLAVAQNEQYLKVKFPSILSVSDTVHDLNNTNSHIIVIYLKDNNSTGIPDNLEAKMPDGSVKKIATEIVKGLGVSQIHIREGDKIKTVNDNSFGSVCCLVQSIGDENFVGVVTAGHVYSGGSYINKGGVLNNSDQKTMSINAMEAGSWYFQLITNGQDIAIAKLREVHQDPAYLSFADTGYNVIADSDVKTSITMISTVSKTKQGFLLDYNLGFPVPYDDGTSNYMSNIILIGSADNRQDSLTLSQKGDSGGCVYNTKTKQLIGLVLGGDAKFTYVLPIKDTLDSWNYKLI